MKKTILSSLVFSAITKIISLLCVLLMVFTYQPTAVLAGKPINDRTAIQNNITNNFEVTQNNNLKDSQEDKLVGIAVGTVVGGAAGGAASVAAVSAMGTAAGLSAAGISSGLAAMGSLVGGGMAAGLVVSAALPVAAAAGVGLALYQGFKFFVPEKEEGEASQSLIVNQPTINNY